MLSAFLREFLNVCGEFFFVLGRPKARVSAKFYHKFSVSFPFLISLCHSSPIYSSSFLQRHGYIVLTPGVWLLRPTFFTVILGLLRALEFHIALSIEIKIDCTDHTRVISRTQYVCGRHGSLMNFLGVS